MATTTKRTAPTAPAYTVAALPTTSVQYRHCNGGTGTQGSTAYQGAMAALRSWAGCTVVGPNGVYSANALAVFALTHLGWCAGSGARATNGRSNSTACKNAIKGNLPAAQWALGAPAAPQVVANMAALAAAGAPAPALATVWATYTGGNPAA